MSERVDPQTSRKYEFVTLVAGGQNFCVEITQIREIRRWSPVTILPHAPAHILGVINLRGAVIPIIDLAAKLGFPVHPPSERHVIIIVSIGEKNVGLMVESVSEILGVDASEVQETPRGMKDMTTQSIQGVIPIDDGMTKIIDLEVLLLDRPQAAA